MSPPQNPPIQLRHIKQGHPSDRYWRLPNYALSNQVSKIRHHLKAHNYPHTGPSSDFPCLLQSLARSLPGYEKCKTAELRLFAQQRRLAKALRSADQTPEFHRFLELPPELRTAIYTFYCADFADEPLVLPTYPPLARVNRQLREEVLPVFYSECTFALGLTASIPSDLQLAAAGAVGGIPHVLRMQRETTLFIKSLSMEHLCHIRNLEVSFESRHLGMGVETFKLRVGVPRRGREGTAKVVVHKAWEDRDDCGMVHPWSGEEVGVEQLRELEERVRSVVGEINKRGEGENHLLVADVYRLRAMLEAFFEEQRGS